jgi:hypothetical protein
MATRILKAPGVLAREIDTSQPTIETPSGVPAGIIGTAERGPAFVPKFFGRNNFDKIFGNISSKHFGSLAAQQWLANSPGSCVYVRVLGAGNCKARNTNGTVTNAGFVVGDPLPQPNDIKGHNPYANRLATDDVGGGIKGRTYFLGCFMSESNGSTIFSDAGIQKTSSVSGIGAKATFTFDDKPNEDTVLTLIDAEGTSATFVIDDENNSGVSGTKITQIAENGGGAAGTAIDLIAKINADAIKITASRDGETVTLRQDIPGQVGNKAITSTLTSAAFDPDDSMPKAFAGGVLDNHAVPILRGVLLAPSGVILHLSGNSNANGNDVASMTTDAAEFGANLVGRKGGLTGSINLSDNSFTMIMNGFKGDSGQNRVDNDVNPYITASFDPHRSNYLWKVMNTNPLDIEKKGHLLLSAFDIMPGLATVTGSGVISEGFLDTCDDGDGKQYRSEEIVFLLTSSKGRGESSLNGVPDYEDFQDRFSFASSPFIISQKYGGKSYDLFKLERLDDGEVDNRYFIKIEDINFNEDTDKYSTFSIIIYDIYTDSAVKTYPGVTFDPSSTNYIARIIGDQKIYFDFDNNEDSQKIIVEGSFENKDNLFRIKLSDDLIATNIPRNAVPMGFRGPGHLVTSGSLLSTITSTDYPSNSIVQGIKQPPFPYKKNISRIQTSNPLVYKVDSNIYWGTEVRLSAAALDTNKLISYTDDLGFPLSARTIEDYVRYYPSHRTDTAPFFSKEKPGDTSSSVTLLDTDAFNHNLFSLEHISVRTGSVGSNSLTLPADVQEWASASYVRNGNITTDHVTKRRAFQASDLTVPGNRDLAKFIVPVINGFNGHNIFSAEKTNMTYRATKMEIDDSDNQGGLNGPTVSAYRKAIDILGSKTDADIQILSLPGQRHPIVTDYAITAVENRFDSLLVMDIEQRDKFNNVVTGSSQTTIPNGVSTTHTINDFKNRSLDSSFAAAYFPDVSIVINDVEFGDVPPSIMALGAISKTDSITGTSFHAPAGEGRSQQNNIIDTGVKITTQAEIEMIYEADVNPIIIHRSVTGGPLINGQKTLLRDQSDLSRIDIRRMLIDIRRKVRSVANTLLFEPNRASTLEKFSAKVNPILSSIRNAGGISRYKVVIDTTTTTQADIENNTIRGKIFLQAVGSIEFVALDFEVTNTIS